MSTDRIEGGIGSGDPLEMLEQDHRMVEQLLEQLAEASEDGQEGLVAQLRQSLEIHMELEEQHLYPLVREVVGDEEGEEAEAEHELARTGLDQLEELMGQPGFDAAVEMLKSGIGHHVQEEESELFPKLRAEAADRIEALAPTIIGARREMEGAMAGEGIEDPTTVIDLTDEDAADAATGDLSSMSKADLMERARDAGIKGRSSMTKEELVEALGRA